MKFIIIFVASFIFALATLIHTKRIKTGIKVREAQQILHCCSNGKGQYAPKLKRTGCPEGGKVVSKDKCNWSGVGDMSKGLYERELRELGLWDKFKNKVGFGKK